MQYFIMHIVVFVFFIISVIFYYVYFVINYIALAHLQKPSSEEITAMVTSLIVSCVCSFIAQAFMFSILWSFMKTDQKVMVEETASEKSTPERPRARSSWLLITDKPTEKEEIDCQETQT